MTATRHSFPGNRRYGDPGSRILAGPARSATDGGASAADLRARRPCGRLRLVVLGRAVGPEAGRRLRRTRAAGDPKMLRLVAVLDPAQVGVVVPEPVER